MPIIAKNFIVNGKPINNEEPVKAPVEVKHVVKAMAKRETIPLASSEKVSMVPKHLDEKFKKDLLKKKRKYKKMQKLKKLYLNI